jgi:hypothetical protein
MATAVTVSGSFHRHLSAIMDAVQEFHDRGVTVLSPADPRVVDAIGPFLFVASDRHRSVRLVQDRHLAAICNSAFLWLVAPDGYVGQSASLELGFAIARGIPIFSQHLPTDLTLRQYVQRVETIEEAIESNRRDSREPRSGPSLLIDPAWAIQTIHTDMDRVDEVLRNPSTETGTSLPHELFTRIERVQSILELPTSGWSEQWNLRS